MDAESDPRPGPLPDVEACSAGASPLEEPRVEVASGVDVASGVEVASGIEVASGVDVASGVEVASGIDVASGVGVASGIDVTEESREVAKGWTWC